MKNLDNLIILILLLIIGFVYFKRNKSKLNFLSILSYPKATETKPLKVININKNKNNINLLENIIERTINQLNSNKGKKIFNQASLPVTKYQISFNRIEPLIKHIISSINTNLPKNEFIILEDTKDIIKYEIEEEVKLNFRLLCQYKTNSKVIDIILSVEIISIRNNEISNSDENIHINHIILKGSVVSNSLPDNEYLKGNYIFTINESMSNNIINDKTCAFKNGPWNNNKINELNNRFTEEQDINTEDLADQLFGIETENEIDTEIAESYFNN